MADSLSEVADQPTSGGKLKSGAWWAAKKALWITPILGVFALAAAPAAATAAVVAAAPTGLGASIVAGEAGLFDAGLEVAKYGITELVPYAWSSIPEIGSALKTSALAGSAELSEFLAPEP